MIDLYQSGTTAREVTEKHGVNLRSIKRLLRDRGARRKDALSQHSRSPAVPVRLS